MRLTHKWLGAVMAFGVFGTALTGCGWHLRGANPVPIALRTLNVQGLASTPLNDALTTALKVAHIQMGTPQSPTLRVIEVKPTRQELSGRLTEVRIGADVAYQLEDNSGNALGGVQTASAHRNYQFDSQTINNQAQQEVFRWQDIYADISQQILRQLSLNRSLKPAS